MKNILVLTAVVALLVLAWAAPVEAGPIRDRIRARFVQRPAPAAVALPAGMIRPAAPVPYSAVPLPSPVRLTVPSCPGGQCPLKK